MKKLFCVMILLIFMATGASAQDKGYELNFKNISMKEFVNFVSTFTGINIVFNEADLKGSVTVLSQKPMKTDEIMDIFYSTLKINGLNAVYENESTMRIVANKDLAMYEDKLTDMEEVESASFVTTVVVLQNYNSIAISNALIRVKSNFGIVEPLRGINAVLLKDFGTRVEKMVDICKYMDKYASEFQLYSIRLENVLASKMEQQIVKLFSELNKNFLSSHIPVVISDDSSNILVVATNEDGFKKIDYLVSQIDVKNLSANQPQVYYLKYANASELEQIFNKMLTDSAPVQGAAKQTKYSVSSDKGTNSIIAMGDNELYNNLSTMIEKLDVSRRQVYVEALILETSLNRGDSFGVEWFGSGADNQNIGFGNLRGSGTLSNIMGMDTSSKTHPSAAMPGGFSAGFIGNVITFNGIKFPSLGAFLNALRSDTGVNVVSNPQILTLDNEEAEVFVGENRPYISSERYDSNDKLIQSFDYKDVGIRLKVTPHITGDDRIILNIEQEVTKFSQASFSQTAPVTQTRSTKTNVMLYDKSVMLISGLMKDDSSVVTTAVPFLSDIPLIGWLFKSSSVANEKTNLMIFITAQIIDSQDDIEMLTDKRWKSSVIYNEQINSMLSDNLTKQSDFITFSLERDLE